MSNVQDDDHYKQLPLSPGLLVTARIDDREFLFVATQLLEGFERQNAHPADVAIVIGGNVTPLTTRVLYVGKYAFLTQIVSELHNGRMPQATQTTHGVPLAQAPSNVQHVVPPLQRTSNSPQTQDVPPFQVSSRSWRLTKEEPSKVTWMRNPHEAGFHSNPPPPDVIAPRTPQSNLPPSNAIQPNLLGSPFLEVYKGLSPAQQPKTPRLGTPGAAGGAAYLTPQTGGYPQNASHRELPASQTHSPATPTKSKVPRQGYGGQYAPTIHDSPETYDLEHPYRPEYVDNAPLSPIMLPVSPKTVAQHLHDANQGQPNHISHMEQVVDARRYREHLVSCRTAPSTNESRISCTRSTGAVCGSEDFKTVSSFGDHNFSTLQRVSPDMGNATPGPSKIPDEDVAVLWLNEHIEERGGEVHYTQQTLIGHETGPAQWPSVPPGFSRLKRKGKFVNSPSRQSPCQPNLIMAVNSKLSEMTMLQTPLATSEGSNAVLGSNIITPGEGEGFRRDEFIRDEIYNRIASTDRTYVSFPSTAAKHDYHGHARFGIRPQDHETWSPEFLDR